MSPSAHRNWRATTSYLWLVGRITVLRYLVSFEVALDPLFDHCKIYFLKPGPNEDESCWELALITIFFNSHRLSSPRARRERESPTTLKKNCSGSNGPFPSCLLPQFQNESWCTTFVMEMSFTCKCIFMQTKLIFMSWMVLHLDSFWNKQKVSRKWPIRWERTRVDESRWGHMRVSGQTRARFWTLIDSHLCLARALWVVGVLDESNNKVFFTSLVLFRIEYFFLVMFCFGNFGYHWQRFICWSLNDSYM